MTAPTQEKIAFAIVGIAGLAVLFSVFRSLIADPLSKLLLKRGRVKWAMRVKKQARETGCDHCKH